MGAPSSGIEAGEQPAAESLLSAFKTIGDPERRRHASLLNYWLSIRGDKEFPPLHDLDPLEISDAGPSSILLELIGGGHDAQVRHLGEALKGEVKVEQIIDAPSPSILSSIAKKLPIVAISRDFLAFEDEFAGPDGPTRCWVTLLPLSAGGAWVDYVYALVSVDGPVKAAAADKPMPDEPEPHEAVAEKDGEAAEPEDADVAPEVIDEPVEAVSEEIEDPVEAVADDPAGEQPIEAEALETNYEEIEETVDESAAKPGFAKLFDSLVGLTNFYGSQPVKVEPVMPDLPDESPAEAPPAETKHTDEPAAAEQATDEPPAQEQTSIEEVVEEQAMDEAPTEEPAAAEPAPEEQAEHPTPAPEGTLQSKLAEVRTKADEARAAKLRANAALYEGLSAAYDFALDAEDAPEEYLRLVEAQGLKIQLRSPMKPVVKLAFDGLCDDSMIKQLEAVLAWAFNEELPRGTLAERIQDAGGIAPILNGEAKAA